MTDGVVQCTDINNETILTFYVKGNITPEYLYEIINEYSVNEFKISPTIGRLNIDFQYTQLFLHIASKFGDTRIKILGYPPSKLDNSYIYDYIIKPNRKYETSPELPLVDCFDIWTGYTSDGTKLYYGSVSNMTQFINEEIN